MLELRYGNYFLRSAKNLSAKQQEKLAELKGAGLEPAVVEKLKNELIFRRDDEIVPLGTLRRSNKEISLFLSFPLGGPLLSLFFVTRRSRCYGIASLLVPRR